MLIQGFNIRGITVRPTGTQTTTDSYFNLVTLLLPGNGTNGATNSTFLDSSTNSFSVTRNGNTTQGTFSSFSQTGWSNYFDGTGDALGVPANSAFSYGTGDFTYEAWIYPTLDGSTGIFRFIMGAGGSGQQDQFLINSAGNRTLIYYDGTTSFTTTNQFNLNSWNHVAVSKSSGTLKIFINGIEGASGSSSANITIGATNIFYIGNRSGGADSPQQAFIGYISNVRVVKGNALYTANFTPPTAPLTAVSGTSLLTCQSNRFIDNSTNAFAITAAGNTAVQAFSPFNPTAAYSAETVGGSGYFDGTGDYLSVADNAALDLGSSDFTIEAWLYMGESDNYTIYAKRATSAIFGGILFMIDTSGGPVVYATFNGSSWGLAMTGYSKTCNLYSWNHVALTRSGSTWTTWVNGQAAQTGTNSGTVPDNTAAMTILAGAANGDFIGGPGYLSSWRLVKGTAVYTSTFTPPTAPLTAITNTSCLLNYTNAGITDATSKNDLESVGGAQISTTQSKWGGSSMYLDGTGDNLVVPSSALLDFGAGDFTVELWVRFNALSTNRILLDRWASGNAGGWQFYWRQTGTSLTFYVNASIILQDSNASRITTNTWYHLALARSGSTLRMFVDGTSVANTTFTTSLSSTLPLSIGSQYTTNTNYLNGYINDLRITRGYARYTADFTPPTAAFPVQ